MKVMVDLNVLLDVLQKRAPFVGSAPVARPSVPCFLMRT
jgi:hypothetical protein